MFDMFMIAAAALFALSTGCSAPCTGEISVADYVELVEEARDFLSACHKYDALLEKWRPAKRWILKLLPLRDRIAP